MKNTLGDLNNHLFAQLERLSDEDLAGDDLVREIKRARAITSLASQVVAGGQLMLRAKQFQDNANGADATVPKLLEG